MDGELLADVERTLLSLGSCLNLAVPCVEGAALWDEIQSTANTRLRHKTKVRLTRTTSTQKETTEIYFKINEASVVHVSFLAFFSYHFF